MRPLRSVVSYGTRGPEAHDPTHLLRRELKRDLAIEDEFIRGVVGGGYFC